MEETTCETGWLWTISIFLHCCTAAGLVVILKRTKLRKVEIFEYSSSPKRQSLLDPSQGLHTSISFGTRWRPTYLGTWGDNGEEDALELPPHPGIRLWFLAIPTRLWHVWHVEPQGYPCWGWAGWSHRRNQGGLKCSCSKHFETKELNFHHSPTSAAFISYQVHESRKKGGQPRPSPKAPLPAGLLLPGQVAKRWLAGRCWCHSIVLVGQSLRAGLVAIESVWDVLGSLLDTCDFFCWRQMQYSSQDSIYLDKNCKYIKYIW